MRKPKGFVSVAAVEQIVGRERRERVSDHDWFGDAFVNSRRRVNSDVGPLICFYLKTTDAQE